jgi:hypothetical protein
LAELEEQGSKEVRRALSEARQEAVKTHKEAHHAAERDGDQYVDRLYDMGDYVEHDADKLLDQISDASVCIEQAAEKFDRALEGIEEETVHSMTRAFDSDRKERRAVERTLGNAFNKTVPERLARSLSALEAEELEARERASDATSASSVTAAQTFAAVEDSTLLAAMVAASPQNHESATHKGLHSETAAHSAANSTPAVELPAAVAAARRWKWRARRWPIARSPRGL